MRQPYHQPIHAILRRQATYALTAFVGAALALEALVPGSVFPFLDVVPLAILAVALLVYDAFRRPGIITHPVLHVAGMGVCLLAVIVPLFLFIRWDGRSGFTAAGVLVLGIGVLATIPKK